MFGPRGAQAPTVPKGEVLGTYDTYPEAQQVIERLSQNEQFPIDGLSIVGNDLKRIEQVTGRLSYGRAAGAGALSGLWFGLFVGVLFSLFPTSAAIGLLPILAAALIGAAAGLLFGVISYAITKRQRDFSSMTQVVASNYQVIVRPDLAARAQQVLANGGADPLP